MEGKNLKRGLKNRHLQMMALGSAIGTGLFYGSASTIALTGPSVMVAYLISGVVIYFIMRMLGEMSVHEPVAGSFSYYATKYWGGFPGFLAGWNYWYCYIMVSMAEITAVGIYVNYWWPEVPQVVAILSMILLGAYLIITNPVGYPGNISNLWSYGGFLPNGVWGMAMACVVVLFSYGGIELLGISAGEAEDPDRSIPKAINQVIWRILIFYVGTMFILMCLWPWNQVGMESSPFVQIFDNVGIPAAAHILNFVVLSAAVSVYNSAIYSNSRMLYGLADKGDAPQLFKRVSSRGVPYIGTLVSSGITLIIVLMNYLFPSQIFMYLFAVVIISAVINWVCITMTHMKFRQYCQENNIHSKFKSVFYPLTNYLCLLFLGGVIFMMYQIPDMKNAVFALPVWLCILYAGYRFKLSREKRS
ncbi:amino acid permease [uncultured Anaerovibrio sp.]|uniref:amino acid permease n=1 Tax=uncultured Anaerovibrio sp. TaxID=361586 RepID=UPI00261178BA|nr:amino acid permease [uncultured Anaerovibrio sp.]